LIETGSLAASIGGAGDTGRGLSAEGLRAIRRAIHRNGLTLLEANSLTEAVQRRMELYEAGPGDYAAYINVGGSSVSVGSRADKQLLAPGLNPEPPDAGDFAQDSVAQRFAALGVPILHLSNMRAIADRYRLPWAPSHTPAPAIGAPFHLREYDRLLSAGLFLLCVTGATVVGLRLRARVSPPRSEPGTGPQR
jgi:poly-gamma-glutamate system protein